LAGKNGLVRRIAWDGTDNLGVSVGSGIFYYRLNVGERIKKGSLVMVK
jgi:hypothetical protein